MSLLRGTKPGGAAAGAAAGPGPEPAECRDCRRTRGRHRKPMRRGRGRTERSDERRVAAGGARGGAGLCGGPRHAAPPGRIAVRSHGKGMRRDGKRMRRGGRPEWHNGKRVRRGLHAGGGRNGWGGGADETARHVLHSLHRVRRAPDRAGRGNAAPRSAPAQHRHEAYRRHDHGPASRSQTFYPLPRLMAGADRPWPRTAARTARSLSRCRPAGPHAAL